MAVFQHLTQRLADASRVLALGYHAVSSTKRRATPTSVVRSEDEELKGTDRKTLIGTAREQRRNQVLLAWMIREHLDFVTGFRFQANTTDPELNADLEYLVDRRAAAQNWDVCGRHGRERFLWIGEAGRVVDGDVAVLYLPDGRLQAIEGDRITTPSGGAPAEFKASNIVNGVEVDSTGKALRYIVCNRNGQSLVYGSAVSASDAWLLGYFDRFDEVRGVSPLASALNTCQDLYESIEAQRIKAKMHAMFGVFIKRTAQPDGDGMIHTAATDSNGNESYSFKIEPGLKVEGLPGDELDTIESRTPSAEFQAFTDQLIQMVLLALDIPVTFYDSRRSSYSAQRQDIIRYQRSVERKRRDIRDMLDWITTRDVARWIGDRTLRLPRSIDPSSLRWTWIGDGIPWIDPLKEVQADILAVSAGFKTRDDVCRERYGSRYRDVVTTLGQEEAAAVEASATITIGQPGQISTRDEEPGETVPIVGGNDDA